MTRTRKQNIYFRVLFFDWTCEMRWMKKKCVGSIILERLFFIGSMTRSREFLFLFYRQFVELISIEKREINVCRTEFFHLTLKQGFNRRHSSRLANGKENYCYHILDQLLTLRRLIWSSAYQKDSYRDVFFSTVQAVVHRISLGNSSIWMSIFIVVKHPIIIYSTIVCITLPVSMFVSIIRQLNQILWSSFFLSDRNKLFNDDARGMNACLVFLFFLERTNSSWFLVVSWWTRRREIHHP